MTPDSLKSSLPETLEGARIYRPLHTVAISNDVPNNSDGNLTETGLLVVREGISTGMSQKELVSILRDTHSDALITRTSLPPITDEVLRQTPGLQLVMGACKEPKVDFQAARELGVEVMGTHENTRQVVDLVMSFIYGFAAGTFHGDAANRRNSWEKKIISQKTFSLDGKKLGILGFGRIGRMLAERAKSNGLEVYAYNDASERHREYADTLEAAAKAIGVNMVGSKEQLFDIADILTIHAGPRNHLGQANTGLVTADDIKRMQGNDRLGILINASRRPLLAPSDEEIQTMIDGGILKGYASDVFDASMENNRSFEYPFAPQDHRIVTTPHIGGSNKEILIKAAMHAARRLEEWARRGNIDRDSLCYPRISIPSDPYEGQIVIAVHRATTRGILAEILREFTDTRLNIAGLRETEDYIPGTRVNRGTAYQVVFADSTNGDPFEETIEDIVRALANLNKVSKGSIRSVRPIPTTPEQRRALEQMFNMD